MNSPHSGQGCRVVEQLLNAELEVMLTEAFEIPEISGGMIKMREVSAWSAYRTVPAGGAVAQAVSCRLPTTAARVRALGQVMWNL
jgi:hypothetical protein